MSPDRGETRQISRRANNACVGRFAPFPRFNFSRANGIYSNNNVTIRSDRPDVGKCCCQCGGS
jgi:hypothetical protein